MGEVGFGQPDDGIIQMAYVVPDLRAAIVHWTGTLRVGPWFVLEHFTGDEPIYRGQPSRAQVRLAMSFAGHMNLELIQPKNDAPSVYRELIERRGYGFITLDVETWDSETWPGTNVPAPHSRAAFRTAAGGYMYDRRAARL
jgi:hypothetical protein